LDRGESFGWSGSIPTRLRQFLVQKGGSISGGYAIVQHDPMFNPQARRQRTEEQIPNQGGKWIKNCDDKGYMTEGIRMTPVEGKSKASR